MDELAVRVGDAERWAVDARLQAAVGDGLLTLPEYEERSGAVWAARTRGELEAVTRDLPLPLPPPVAAPAVPPSGRRLRPRRILALMSGDTLSGPLAPGQRVEAYALMGGAVVDLQRDDLPERVDVHAVAVMGGIEVLVPRGVEVHVSGLSVMGGRDTSVDVPRPGAPVVHVQAYALMGAVEVKHGRGVGHGPQQAAVPQPRSVSLEKPQAAPPSAHGSAVVGHRPVHRGPRRGGRLLAALGLAALAFGGAQALGADNVSVFGSSVMFAQSGDDVRTGLLFGSATVVVPDDAQVNTGGLVVFGSTECSRAACGPRADPVVDEVTVRTGGAFGSVEVLTASEYEAELAEEAAEDAADDRDD